MRGGRRAEFSDPDVLPVSLVDGRDESFQLTDVLPGLVGVQSDEIDMPAALFERAHEAVHPMDVVHNLRTAELGPVLVSQRRKVLLEILRSLLARGVRLGRHVRLIVRHNVFRMVVLEAWGDLVLPVVQVLTAPEHGYVFDAAMAQLGNGHHLPVVVPGEAFCEAACPAVCEEERA